MNNKTSNKAHARQKSLHGIAGQRSDNTSRQDNGAFARTALASLMLAILCTALMTLISPLILLSTSDPATYVGITSYIITALALIISGIFAVRSSGGSLLAALASGAMFTLIVFVASLVCKNGELSRTHSLTLLLYPLLSLAGGALARPRAVKKPHFKKGR